MKLSNLALLRLEKQIDDLYHDVRLYLAHRENVPYDKVWLSNTAGERLCLLNLRVWSLRYHVPLAFILDTLLGHFSAHRRMTRGAASLGVAVRALCGRAAEEHLQEEVARAYPAGTNHQAYLHSLRQPLYNMKPVKSLPYESVEEMVSRYGEVMHYRHKDVLKGCAFQRPYRDNPWPTSLVENIEDESAIEDAAAEDNQNE